LGRRHQFCHECGGEVNKAKGRQQEHRGIRTLPVDRDTLEMLKTILTTFMYYDLAILIPETAVTDMIERFK